MKHFSQMKGRMRESASRCVLIIGLATMPMVAFGQEATTLNNNYYAANTPALRQLLRNNEEVHLGKAQQDLATRKPHRLEYAVADFGYILSRWPNHPQALMGMLEAATLLKRPNLIEKHADAAIAVAPEIGQTYIILGVFYMRNDQNQKAESLLKKALEMSPESVNVHYNLALLYLDTKRPVLANEHAQKAYALGHPLPGLRNRLKDVGAWNPSPTAQSNPASPAKTDAGAGNPQ